MTDYYSILIDPHIKMLRSDADAVAHQIADAVRFDVIIAEEYTTKQKFSTKVDAVKVYGAARRHPLWDGKESVLEEACAFMFVMHIGNWKIRDWDEARFAAMCVSEIVAYPVLLIPKKIRPAWRGHAYPKTGWGEEVIWRDERMVHSGLKNLAIDSVLNEMFFRTEKEIWGVV